MNRFGSIYKITNNINGKCYFGLTIRQIKRRWSEHLSSTKNGSNQLLHKAIRKYGKENFKIEEIIVAFNKIDLNELEKYFIDKFKTISPGGYNIEAGGENKFITSKGIKQSPEWISKRTMKRNIPVTGKNIKSGKTIEFDSFKDACNFLGIPTNNGHSISLVCNKKQHFAYGYFWKYKNDLEFPFYDKRKISKRTVPSKLRKTITSIDLNNNKKHYQSISEVEHDGFDPSTVAKVCKGLYKSHKGFKFSYTESGNER